MGDLDYLREEDGDENQADNNTNQSYPSSPVIPGRVIAIAITAIVAVIAVLKLVYIS